jgi:ABC-2 type transport system ATP-binding protein
MKRRLNMVASLLHEPEILLCDEPTVGIDPQSRNAIFDFLEEQNENGLTVVYTTHYMEEVERMCKRIAIIDTGKIIALGSRNELVSKLPYTTSISFDVENVVESLRFELSRFGKLQEIGNEGTLIPKDGFRLSEFFGLLESQNVPYHRFQVKQPTLEALFLHLTGKQLRD